MNKILLTLFIILTLSSMLHSEVKIGALNVLHPEFTPEIISSIDWLLMLEPELDLIVGPAEGLGGDSNKARIIFEDSAGVIRFTPADDFERSREVYDVLRVICSLAAVYEVTIIPGTLWEVDINARCFEAAPIIGPDGNIQRVRRKAHQTVTNPLIDPGIHPETLFTRDSSMYTYLLTICNETRDIPEVYGIPTVRADILLVMNRHWMEGFYLAADELRFSCPPDWDEIATMVSITRFEDLLDFDWIRSTAPMVVSSFGERAGAAIIGNFFSSFRPEEGWFELEACSESPFGVIVTCDPDSPVVKRQISLSVCVSDSTGAPVESLVVSVRHVDRPVWHSEHSDSLGWASFQTCMEGDYLLNFETDSFMVYASDSMVTLSYDAPMESLEVVVLVDTTTAIREKPLPEDFGINIYPNPFNSSVNIRIQSRLLSGQGSRIQGIEVYNINGRLVHNWGGAEATTIRSSNHFNLRSPGEVYPVIQSFFSWSPDESVSSGIYLVRLSFGDKIFVKNIIYLK